MFVCLFVFVCLIIDSSTSEEPPAKRSRLETEDGEKIIAEFLDAVRRLSLREDINEDDMKTEFEKMKLNFMNSDNDYVQSILNSIL